MAHLLQHSRLLFLFFLLIMSLAFTQCTKEGEDFYFEDSYILGLWESDHYHTFDGELNTGNSQLAFFDDYVLLNGSSTQFPWEIADYGTEYYDPLYFDKPPYKSLKLNNTFFQILELTSTKLIFIENRDNKNQIWYYTRK